MARRRFQDRPPGTMAFQHRVGESDRTRQPKRLPVKVTHPGGRVEWVPAAEFDRRRKAMREIRGVLRQFEELAVEIREERSLPPAVAEALAWSQLERTLAPGLWQTARERYERGERSDTAIPDAHEVSEAEMAAAGVEAEETVDEPTRREVVPQEPTFLLTEPIVTAVWEEIENFITPDDGWLDVLRAAVDDALRGQLLVEEHGDETDHTETAAA